MAVPGDLLIENRTPRSGGFDGFPIDNLGFTHVDPSIKFSLHAAGDDLQVQFSHAGKNRLAGVFVFPDTQGGVFGHKLFQYLLELLLIAVGFGFNGHGDYRFVKIHFFQQHRMFLLTQGFAGGGVLESHDSDDGPRAHRVYPLRLLACIIRMRDSFSFLLRLGLYTSVPAESFPL